MKKVICLYGPAAAGKTTQAELLTKKYGLFSFGMGNHLRAEINSHSELGKEIAETVAQGLLIPDHLMDQVLESIKEPARTTGIVLDGFPRVLSQAKSLAKVLQTVNLEVELFVLLDINEDEILNRIAARAKLTGRHDDLDPQAISNRLAVYNKESLALIDHYHSLGKLVKIDGSLPREDVFKEIEKHL